MSDTEKKPLELPGLLSMTAILVKRIYGLSEEQPVYVKVFLPGEGQGFFVSQWTAWEDEHTKEKLVFLVGDDKCILTDLRNVAKIEFLIAEPPDSKEAMGFQVPKEPLEGVPAAWLDLWSKDLAGKQK